MAYVLHEVSYTNLKIWNMKWNMKYEMGLKNFNNIYFIQENQSKSYVWTQWKSK